MEFETFPKTSVPEASDLPQVEACILYLALTRTVPADNAIEEPSLGGKLLYAGELDGRGRARVIAGNVAGCATLAGTADVAAQKQSIRDGVVDFLVTSLDEALRILKNEVRQRKTVAVCVGASPDTVEQEMMDRGVQPDLVFAAGREMPAARFGIGTQEIPLTEPDPGLALLRWEVELAPARWMARLDSLALGCMSRNSFASRWIRLSPRYLGRSAMGQRMLYCDPDSGREIMRRFEEAVRGGEVGAEVAVSFAYGGETTALRMRPGEGPAQV